MSTTPIKNNGLQFNCIFCDKPTNFKGYINFGQQPMCAECYGKANINDFPKITSTPTHVPYNPYSNPYFPPIVTYNFPHGAVA